MISRVVQQELFHELCDLKATGNTHGLKTCKQVQIAPLPVTYSLTWWILLMGLLPWNMYRLKGWGSLPTRVHVLMSGVVHLKTQTCSAHAWHHYSHLLHLCWSSVRLPTFPQECHNLCLQNEATASKDHTDLRGNQLPTRSLGWNQSKLHHTLCIAPTQTHKDLLIALDMEKHSSSDE